jgi:hypothetical protein
MNEWISVKERMPKNYQPCLIKLSYKSIYIVLGASYWESKIDSPIKGKQFTVYISPWSIDSFNIPLKKVTHWMPLPASPECKENQ